jgi:microcystin-dependent protein
VADISYNTAPDWRTTWFDDQAVALIDGYLRFSKSSDHNVRKAVYQSNIITPPATTPPAYANPLQLQSGANIPAIFYASDENYFVELWDGVPDVGTLVQTVDNWNSPENTDPTPKATEVDFTNYISNSDFNQLVKTKFESVQLQTGVRLIAFPKWVFTRSNNNATITITYNDFISGQTEVPNQPARFLSYSCTAIGAGAETFKVIQHRIEDVRSFNAEEITFTFYAKSSTNSEISIASLQVFGTGGSSSSGAIFDQVQLTSSWTKYVITGTVPSISGKIIGEDSYIAFEFGLPLNEIADIDISHVQLNRGNVELEYNYLPKDFTRAKSIGISFQDRPIDVTRADDDRSLVSDKNGIISWGRTIPAGTITASPINAALPGNLICDGQNQFSYLFLDLRNVLTTLYGYEYMFAQLVTNVVTTTAKQNGNVTDATAGTSPFTVNVIQQGTGALPERFTVTTTAASALSPGQYFTFTALNDALAPINFFIWFVIDNTGVLPVVPGATGIPVQLNATDSDTTVASKIGQIMDPLAFAVPDYRGYFLRGRDAGAGIDPDAASRTDRGDGTTGDQTGTKQQDEFKSHTHTVNTSTTTTTTGNYDRTTAATSVNAGTGISTAIETLAQTPTALSLTSNSSSNSTAVNTGGLETRAKNIYVTWQIKY